MRVGQCQESCIAARMLLIAVRVEDLTSSKPVHGKSESSHFRVLAYENPTRKNMLGSLLYKFCAGVDRSLFLVYNVLELPGLLGKTRYFTQIEKDRLL